MTQSQRKFLLYRLSELQRAAQEEVDRADRRDSEKTNARIRREYGAELRRRFKHYRALCNIVRFRFGVEASVDYDGTVKLYRPPVATPRRQKLNAVVKKYRDELALGAANKTDALAFAAQMELAIRKVL